MQSIKAKKLSHELSIKRKTDGLSIENRGMNRSAEIINRRSFLLCYTRVVKTESDFRLKFGIFHRVLASHPEDALSGCGVKFRPGGLILMRQKALPHSRKY